MSEITTVGFDQDDDGNVTSCLIDNMGNDGMILDSRRPWRPALRGHRNGWNRSPDRPEQQCWRGVPEQVPASARAQCLKILRG